MKAISCPKCGALVKEISLKEKFANCDYCGAKILLEENKEKIVEIPDQEEKKLTPWQQHHENYRKLRERTQSYDTTPVNDSQSGTKVVALLATFGIAILLFALGISRGCLYRPLGGDETKVSNNRDSKEVRSPPTPTPLPKINYRAEADWNSITLMEQYVIPRIDTTKLPTFDTSELNKTVFKNRRVQVTVTIDTEGNVISAEALSGHPVLQEAAVKAAEQTLFKPQNKTITHTLTYYFRLISE